MGLRGLLRVVLETEKVMGSKFMSRIVCRVSFDATYNLTIICSLISESLLCTMTTPGALPKTKMELEFNQGTC